MARHLLQAHPMIWKILAAWFAISLVVSPIIARRIVWCGSMDGISQEGS